MRCAKIICMWMGSKSRANNNCPTMDIIDEIIDLETNLDKGYPTDTFFVINKCGIPEQDNYLDKFNNVKTFNGNIKVIKRPNVGLSFGAYLETYYKLKEEYDYWFFCEDDVIIYEANYVKMFIENLLGDASFVALAPISNFHPIHCGGGCGLTSTHFMSKVYPNEKLPSILDEWCSLEGVKGKRLESIFTSGFKLANCKNISPLASNWKRHSGQLNYSKCSKINHIYKVGKRL
jgi:hypothetical protein